MSILQVLFMTLCTVVLFVVVSRNEDAVKALKQFSKSQYVYCYEGVKYFRDTDQPVYETDGRLKVCKD